MHHLRAALDGAGGTGSPLATVKVGRETGYILKIPAEAVDAHRFEQLAADGREALSQSCPTDAAALLGQALELWRGRPLADAADKPFAVAEIARLNALYRAVVAGRVEADVHRGLHREVTGELEALVGRWPEDEGIRSLLVSCLAKVGRAHDAARACQEGISLALNLGLDITRLQALQRDVLNGVPGASPGG
ncbi:MAG: AfsR/SARP family transcriptional regulator [Actinobacteria bacterium]|nr:AfsR/SARP family transcriptional regulator [Actinomycetota bacterium]